MCSEAGRFWMKNYVDLDEKMGRKIDEADDGLGFTKNWGRTLLED